MGDKKGKKHRAKEQRQADAGRLKAEKQKRDRQPQRIPTTTRSMAGVLCRLRNTIRTGRSPLGRHTFTRVVTPLMPMVKEAIRSSCCNRSGQRP
jgi:hypothetical protein